MAALALAAAPAVLAAAPRARAQAAEPPAPAPAPDAEGALTAAYFPLAAGAERTYDKVTTSRLRPGERRSTLTRGGRPATDARGAPRAGWLVIEDGEGDALEVGIVDGAPALAAQTQRARGFTDRFDPPLPLFPASARLGEEHVFRAAVEHVTARSTDRGEATRRVRLDAIEDVVVPAGRFSGCLRFRAVTDNRPTASGAFAARVEETTWLALGVGEVKSEQDITIEAFGVPLVRARVTLALRASAPPPAPPPAPEPPPASPGEPF